MYQKTFSRQDFFQVILLSILVLVIAVFSGTILHPIASVLVIGFFVGMLVFISDMVSKDRYEPPYFRCDGCGNLYPEREQVTWNDTAQICKSCSSDKPSQIEYAVSKPMFLKRLRKY